jgi:DNA-binding HxlR family transcriptional regulator
MGTREPINIGPVAHWTVLVVGALSDGTRRFSEIRDAVGGITPKELTQTLRALEREGLVTRKIYSEVPPCVEHTLTDLGSSWPACGWRAVS